MKSNQSCTNDNGRHFSLLDFYIGLLLAVLSCFIMSWSYIVKKISLNRLVHSGRRAGDGGYGYLRDWMWWLGLLLMGAGEIMNSVAYGFAPASLVTPLGALSVLFTALLSAKILKEHLNLIGKIGCAVCLGGSTIIVIHAPKEQLVTSIEEFTARYLSYGFLIFLSLTIVMSLVLLIFLAPKYGKTNPMIYILVSSSVGSISVMSVKGIGVFVKEIIGGKFIWNYWIVYFTVVVLVLGIVVQINYLNKALDMFNANVVTLLIYVCFTVFVIVASSILLEEWSSLTLEDCLGIIDGFCMVIIGFLLLYLFKDMNVTWHKTKSDFLNSIYKDRSDSLERRASISNILDRNGSIRSNSNDLNIYPNDHDEDNEADYGENSDKIPFLSTQTPAHTC